ncbi:MAG: HAMP domain-containing histidine kinase [Candidatus Melainabacteria bacterium]|nr:MAG: HAMP domain-containing histidine kinase [Candidatus Melainabacteria bacterium]
MSIPCRLYQYILEKHFGEIDPRLQEVMSVLKRSNESVMQLLMNLLEIYRYDVSAPQFEYEGLDLGCLVKKSTGLINCESKSGEGTTFTITLPRSLTEAANSSLN